MTNITIKDTGYVSVNTSGTQFSGDNIVNSGTAIELIGIDFSYNIASNVDNITEPANATSSVVNHVSTKNPQMVINGLIKRGKLDGTGTDMATIVYLKDMVRTKGVKCIYYNDTVTTTTGYPCITKFLGVTDSEGGHPTEPHFHVRFTNFRISQSSNSNGYKFSLEGIETA